LDLSLTSCRQSSYIPPSHSPSLSPTKQRKQIKVYTYRLAHRETTSTTRAATGKHVAILNAVCCSAVCGIIIRRMFRGVCNVCYGARLSMVHQASGRESTSDTTRRSRTISAAVFSCHCNTRSLIITLHHSSSAISSACITTSQVNLLCTRNTLNTSSCTTIDSANCAI